MDEYQLEIQALRRTLGRLKAEEAEPQILDEYEAELRNLAALYRAANETFEAGQDDPELRSALAELGMGDWAFPNVYAFIYEAALDEDLAGRELSAVVDATDYTASLRAALESGGPASTG